MDKYNILIAEDDKEIARSIGIYLKNENFEIFYAEDGLEALEIFKNYNGPHDAKTFWRGSNN